MEYKKPLYLRWADLDPNYHLRHSAYYDIAAQFRTELLQEFGIGLNYYQESKFNPILLKEECVFKREIRYGDEIMLYFHLKEVTEDYSKYTIMVSFVREKDQKVCAELTIYGAWFNLATRKLQAPPQELVEIFDKFPRLPQEKEA